MPTSEKAPCTPFREQGTEAYPLDQRQLHLGYSFGQQGAEA
jgi:hypothetical protein